MANRTGVNTGSVVADPTGSLFIPFWIVLLAHAAIGLGTFLAQMFLRQPLMRAATYTATASPLTLTGTAADNVGVTQYLVERCQGSGCSTFAQIGTAPAGFRIGIITSTK